MENFFKELDYQPTPIGHVSLRWKRIAMLNNLEVYEVKLDDAFLMSSMFHAVEDALADLGLAELDPGEWDIVVGGLGLGYTAVATLAHTNVRSLLVVDLLDAVIGWHRQGLVPLGPKLTQDPRCHLVQGDFFALAVAPGGFEQGRRYHAVLLDVDHSPRDLLHPQNAAFYSVAGLQGIASQLHEGGVFAMWSNDPPDGEFLELLTEVFLTARADVVRFPNPLLGEDSASTVYVARKAGASPRT